ncbi:sigma-54 interaction domain-containing protein [Ferviditalea candida]|uniref:HTH-type transcriptional regulatory protein TyrR n=1 Tax=Ferviditalea candida TaxID=3108399 RepID=A0ABU5ZH08_9BACL|nr:sigma 54-interacting transcriptional regulator [Paenibacillaceae bacterium T2]
MDISVILSQNYRIISHEEWQQASFTHRESEIVFLCDPQDNLIGAVASDNRNRIIPVGLIFVEDLERYIAQNKWEEFSLWFCKNKQNQLLGWADRESIYRFLYLRGKKQNDFYQALLSSFPHQLTVVDHESGICFANQTLQDLDESKLEWIEQKVNKVYGEASCNGASAGALQVYWDAEQIEELPMNLANYSNMFIDLKAVFESSYDVIFVTDGEGKTLRVSSACKKFFGYDAEYFIGKSIYELEKKGTFKPSITRLVLESKEKVQEIQITSTGRRLMVLGTPVKDKNGKIIRVVNVSRDITQESQLKSELEVIRALMEGYKRELKQLKQMAMRDDSFIFKSEKMENAVTLASKVAEVDSTVLILGESGVGKELIASYIHQNSHRRDKPFIKLNCGAIPENLLESELFGYEKGAFTGASKDGKKGTFELANEGTLFLDEIGEIPLPLQVKLLRVLQENELVRLGGTKPIKLNVRIIAATNRNLQEETKKGNFREDLYYRLNVVPVYIPPLRERKEDILPLTLFFIEKYNEKYKKNKVFSQEVLEFLQAYNWEGNVRELQNIVERLVVITDQNLVEKKHLPEMMLNSQNAQSRITVSDVMPLKEAVNILERKLLLLAKKKYGTTTEMARVLGVDQSTISRKITKFMQ